MSPLLTPLEAQKAIPLHSLHGKRIESYRDQIQNILTGNDRRHLLIVGPCSIHNEESAYEYGQRLTELAECVEDEFLIIMRTYLEKPRTQGGWKGFIYDPNLDGTSEIQEAILRSRKLLVSLTELGLPLATEFLDPLITPYIQDLISWGSIGARTSESPIHRQLAAGLSMPVGIKNRTDGSIDVAIAACIAASCEHTFLAIDDNGKVCQKRVTGNPLPHIVLRGGSGGPNFDAQSITETKEKLLKAALTPAIIVDCSHDNSKKNYYMQTEVFSTLLEQITHTDCPIRGIMLESFLQEGQQPIKEAVAKDISVTDGCLDWQSTNDFVLYAAAHISAYTPCMR